MTIIGMSSATKRLCNSFDQEIRANFDSPVVRLRISGDTSNQEVHLPYLVNLGKRALAYSRLKSSILRNLAPDFTAIGEPDATFDIRVRLLVHQ